MRQLLAALMLAIAALFVFGAIQHTGFAIGPFREPRILPATIVESICALALAWGAVAVLLLSANAWRGALVANLAAIAGVTIGIVAPAVGAGPRTASNDRSHRVMLALAVACIVLLFISDRAAALRHSPLSR